ncbi:hypothetical protein CFP65_3923 [Kitasatospora sp. MMS16-BH015]|uniref:hypothetical protein n=1 Tax=Kitasatospora sp. MMS16-BH015 TaxID=2018025 RepID=UPI000CA0C155|nr:hypothetical protein [Kitasatospora sp. MMS16-BH015]AUG78696.1 hypothetical protein CFP65_3923 [Kitasatospora sp. MMS16-BH015]
MRKPVRRTLTSLAATTALALTLAACGSGGSGSGSGDSKADMGGMPGMSTSSGASNSATHDMSAMGGNATDGDGLAAEQAGYRLDPIGGLPAAGTPGAFTFRITAPGGAPLTAFTAEQTKDLHFYAVRSDLSGFQHLHPTMAADGTWTAPLAALRPGAWRVYTQLTPAEGPGKGTMMVLSRPLTVPGQAADTPLPAAAESTTVDGYTVTVAGKPVAGQAVPLTVTVSKDGRPVTDLQPYLDTYAHLTAFHAGDQAFAHLHPQTPVGTGTGTGGPSLPFHAELPKAGDWRLFLQFQTAGTLHTAALTLKVS